MHENGWYVNLWNLLSSFSDCKVVVFFNCLKYSILKFINIETTLLCKLFHQEFVFTMTIVCFRLKDKINAPPAVLDFQEMPKSVERILKINKAIKDGSMSLKKKKRKMKKKSWLINTENLDGKEIKLPGMTRPEKPVPNFVQQSGESDEHFLHRLEQACHVRRYRYLMWKQGGQSFILTLGALTLPDYLLILCRSFCLVLLF